VVSRTSFVLKGGGWGADLYASKKAAEKGDAPPAEAAKTPDKNAVPATSAAPAAAPAPSGSGTGTSSSPSAPASAPAAPSTTEKKDRGT
jgi:hypothetical protein